MNPIFRQKFIIFGKLRLGVNYCWKYGPSKLLLQFIEYHLDWINNQHTKIAVNLIMQFFESYYQMKCLVKVWRFLFNTPNNDSLLIVNIFKLHNYQTFGLMKTHNVNKFWFTNNRFILWKCLVWINGPSKMVSFNFCLFHFSKFQKIIIKNLMKNPSF